MNRDGQTEKLYEQRYEQGDGQKEKRNEHRYEQGDEQIERMKKREARTNLLKFDYLTKPG